MWQHATQDGSVPWRRQALSAVALMTMALAGPRADVAAAPEHDLETARMPCGGPWPAVRLHLIDRTGLSADGRDELMRETLAPWLRVGAAVSWSVQLPERPARAGEPQDLYVFLKADARTTIADETLPMASIRFVQGQPSNYITVQAGHVARRLATLLLDERPLADAPRILRDRILGRVLGRAVAHEVGHFLTGSSAHAETGLMRASHPMGHLMIRAHHAFEVTPQTTPGCLVARRDEQP